MADDTDEISRREAIKRMSLTAGALVVLPVLQNHSQAQVAVAEHSHTPVLQPQTRHERFFNEVEYRTISELSERIIPSDDSSPGAKEARVADYIDMVVGLSAEPVKVIWREGLAAINSRSHNMFSRSFPEASESQQVELLKIISRNERAPQTAEERFFRVVKVSTIDGYYTSEIGIRTELGYKGNSVLKEFLGCTHSDHIG